MVRFAGEGRVSLMVEGGRGWISEREGEMREVKRGEVYELLGDKEREVVVCHKSRSLLFVGMERCEAAVYDVLGLYGFVRPAKFCVPSVRGLCEVMGLEMGEGAGLGVLYLEALAEMLLEELEVDKDKEAGGIAMFMGRGGWLWSPYVWEACGGSEEGERLEGMDVWKGLKQWTDLPPRGESLNESVDAKEAILRLDSVVEGRGKEKREGQRMYLEGVTRAFGVYDREEGPHMVLAEGETGVGKTLGYLVPSVMWSRKNGVPVWISTYSRYLQSQVEREAHDIWGGEEEGGRRRLVVRQGRENYVCLLNYEDALWDMGGEGDRLIGLGYVARWLGKTVDGNFHHGDFPTWLRTLDGNGDVFEGLSDRRGDCIFQGCRHYRRCFIEREQRQAELADVVVSNHALSLLRLWHQGVKGGEEEEGEKVRMVFDEGHHLLDVADKMLCVRVSVEELLRVRHWILGRNLKGGRLEKGLRHRLTKLGGVEEKLWEIVAEMEVYARLLPGEGSLERIRSGESRDEGDLLFLRLRELVLRRDEGGHRYYEQELLLGRGYFCGEGDEEIKALGRGLAETLEGLKACGDSLLGVLESLRGSEKISEGEGMRGELVGAIRSLEMWLLSRFEGMLGLLHSVLGEGGDEEGYVDRAVIERVRGRDVDVGMTRHYLDPGFMLSDLLKKETSGCVVTSGTLSMKRAEEDERWEEANKRLGLYGFEEGNRSYVGVDSPFDWCGNTRILMVNDVDKQDINALIEAFSVLMEGSGGGALGLFTSLERMRKVVPKLRKNLLRVGVEVYAQHMDRMAVSDLVRMFALEENSCLVGSDGLRDGLDVAGRGLRSVIFERLPWPRPDILHKKRREVSGGWKYTKTQMGWKLRQAYGRLLRRKDDKGVMVVLEGQIPEGAMMFFPKSVEAKSVSLEEARREMKIFLGT